jgi:gliding motility-associated lipoprotein GldH
MTMKVNRAKLFLNTLIVLCFFSCDSLREHDSYVSVANKTWNSSKKVTFPFSVTDTVLKKNLFINIRNNNEYAFSNLFLITELEFPNGKKVIDTLEYEMTDASGQFLGNGLTEIKENKLFYKEQVVFPMPGNYSVTIRQSMRKNGEVNGIELLEGITDVGFRIEKVN